MVPWRGCADTVGARTVENANSKYGRVGQTRHLYCRQNNMANGVNGKPCPPPSSRPTKRRAGLALMAGFSRDAGSGGILHRGHWLVDSGAHSGSWLKGRGCSLKGMCWHGWCTHGQRCGFEMWARWEDAQLVLPTKQYGWWGQWQALTYRPPTGRRRGERDYLVIYIEEQHNWYVNSLLNSERHLFLYTTASRGWRWW